MDLDEFAVSIEAALLVERGLRGAGADHRIGRLAEDRADAACGHNDGISGEGADLHGAKIDSTNATAGAIPIEHRAQKFPVLIFGDLAFRLVAAHLLIERVKQLLPGGGSRKRRAMVER